MSKGLVVAAVALLGLGGSGEVMAQTLPSLAMQPPPSTRPAAATPVLLSPQTPSLPASATPGPTLPSLALDPQAPPPSIWRGLYAGGDLMVAGAKGSKPMVGGGGFVGYDHVFANNMVLGVQASAGYAPLIFQPGPFKGFDYTEASAEVGYRMGRLTPFVAAGVVLAKPNGTPGAGYWSAADSVNNVFNGGSDLATSGLVAAGFDYALTSNTSVGLAAVVATGHGLAPPLAPLP
jgi:outer membrane immunogenic protein